LESQFSRMNCQMFWTELVGGDQVQVLVPNGGILTPPFAPEHYHTCLQPFGDPVDVWKAGGVFHLRHGPWYMRREPQLR
jgi:hypothetical protein